MSRLLRLQDREGAESRQTNRTGQNLTETIWGRDRQTIKLSETQRQRDREPGSHGDMQRHRDWLSDWQTGWLTLWSCNMSWAKHVTTTKIPFEHFEPKPSQICKAETCSMLSVWFIIHVIHVACVYVRYCVYMLLSLWLLQFVPGANDNATCVSF